MFVVTVIWMYRIATNVRAFQRDTLWSPLFAIFGWMLPPFVLYIIPFLVLRELWKASDPTDVNDTESWRGSADNPFIWAWLVLYGIAPIFLLAVLGRIVPRRWPGLREPRVAGREPRRIRRVRGDLGAR